MTLYATERAIGCRSSMSSSSSNEKFFFTARRPPKGATTKVRLSLHSFPIYPQNFSPPPPPTSIFARDEDAHNNSQILLISRARIQNRSREGFLKFKRRSPSARDREWVGVHRRRQKVGRASSKSSPKWCWLRAKKRERDSLFPSSTFYGLVKSHVSDRSVSLSMDPHSRKKPLPFPPKQKKNKKKHKKLDGGETTRRRKCAVETSQNEALFRRFYISKEEKEDDDGRDPSNSYLSLE